MKTHTIHDFDYTLPDHLIAQFPVKDRAASRLLVVPKQGDFIDAQFPDFLNCINENDLIIFNDTRVMNARLFGKKESGGKIECLIERVLDDHTALAHLKSSIISKIDSMIILENILHAKIIARQNDLFVLEFSNSESLIELLEKYGQLPLPPYITRSVSKEDFERYQTVYAKNLGAVAAHTAGLHFDEKILQTLRDKKIDMGFVTLHVGAGTFQPVRVENISDHVMHAEFITVPSELCKQIHVCHARGGRVIAIGTTVVRALESASISGKIASFLGETKIFITPVFQFNVVDILLTNFHLPKSTLLMLVCAFAGYKRVMQAYREAIEKHYRFFSYGDAMVLYRSNSRSTIHPNLI